MREPTPQTNSASRAVARLVAGLTRSAPLVGPRAASDAGARLVAGRTQADFARWLRSRRRVT
jgi:hypothetical protein